VIFKKTGDRLKEDKGMPESYKSGLGDEISRLEAGIKKIVK
jgi:hypothetical protein